MGKRQASGEMNGMTWDFEECLDLMYNQQRTIARMWTPDRWEISFRRQVFDWEITRVADFLNTIDQFKGTQEGKDELWWQGSNKWTFRVGKAYRWLNNHNQQNVNWPWKLCGKCIPYKLSCFIWLLSKEVVLTQNNLMKRGDNFLSEMCFLRRTSRNCSTFVPSLQDHMSALEAIHKP